MSAQEQFETELRGMRPRRASAEFERHIIERLNARTRIPPPLRWDVMLAGALAAACLAAISLWWSDDPRQKTNKNVSGSLAVSPAEDADLRPTVLAYRHALVRSANHFSDLLDKHAVVTLPHDPARNGVRAFIRPDTEHPSWIGEL